MFTRLPLSLLRSYRHFFAYGGVQLKLLWDWWVIWTVSRGYTRRNFVRLWLFTRLRSPYCALIDTSSRMVGFNRVVVGLVSDLDCFARLHSAQLRRDFGCLKARLRSPLLRSYRHFFAYGGVQSPLLWDWRVIWTVSRGYTRRNFEETFGVYATPLSPYCALIDTSSRMVGFNCVVVGLAGDLDCFARLHSAQLRETFGVYTPPLSLLRSYRHFFAYGGVQLRCCGPGDRFGLFRAVTLGATS